ncbi:ABC transporter permease [Verticiella sediminum]
MGMLLIACVLVPLLVDIDDKRISLKSRFLAPLSDGFLLGSDELGRSVLARLITAGQISLSVGLFSMLLSTMIGVTLGLIAGYYRGVISALIMRLVDAMLCFPTIFLLLALSALIKPGVGSIIVLVALSSWMEVTRVVEGQVRSLRERDYVAASRVVGAGDMHIMFREILPNAIGPILVAATLTVAHAILAESYISFLGFGIQPPTPSWGNMLNNAQSSLSSAPWLAILPGALIAISVTCFNFIGEGLRIALDPKGSAK